MDKTIGMLRTEKPHQIFGKTEKPHKKFPRTAKPQTPLVSILEPLESEKVSSVIYIKHR